MDGFEVGFIAAALIFGPLGWMLANIAAARAADRRRSRDRLRRLGGSE